MPPRAAGELDKLRRSDTLKSAFISRISHELRTPLMVSMGVLDILKAKVKGDDEKLLGHARDALKDLSETIADLLAFGDLLKIDRPLNRKETHLAALIEESFQSLKGFYDDKRIRLALDLADVPKLTADPSILLAVFKALAANAVIYNTLGGRVRARLTQQNNNAVYTIENDGRPLPAESLGQKFDSFYAIAETMADKERVRGLGLAMASMAAERHAGKLTLAPRPGGGAVVTLSLPLQAVRKAKPRPASKS